MNELRTQYQTGDTVYALIIRADGKVWDAPSFVDPVSADWDDYAVPIFEQGDTGLYYGTMPNVPAGLYDVFYYLQSGMESLPSDILIAQAPVYWTGQADISLGTSLPTPAPGSPGGLLTLGMSPGQVNPSQGKVPATLAASDVSGNLPANVLSWLSLPVAQSPDGHPAVALASSGLDTIVIEDGLNLRQAVALIAAAVAGALSGGGTAHVVIKGAGVGTTRIDASVDAAGNRLTVTLSPPT